MDARPPEDAPRIAILHHTAGVHYQHAVANAGNNTEVMRNQYPDVSHMYADNGAMQLVRWPAVRRDRDRQPLWRRAVGLRGDADRVAGDAALGQPGRADGQRPPEGVVRTRPRLGPGHCRSGKANPIACILSFAMALRYSFDLGEEATRVEKAVEKVLADGVRTAGLMSPKGAALRSPPPRWATRSLPRWTQACDPRARGLSPGR